ncbi:MAG: DUF190 domain-containing protein [Candidatus Mcinerneyibacterium aminivorans]|uniref:DUF190 domain-containing protein n=1 Tax=Candidatus Mcinerneyibacterium aminivorans TaxID=2703815 RepID=A0A5D0MMM6_9BACT|nr:MAG: DUF190 domain-containing protein [Candidatus Mcinerneyibacterium aminivorans]
MKEFKKKFKLSIYIGEDDQLKGESLYQKILSKAKDLNISGATAIRGVMGFGKNKHMHSSKFIRLFSNMPVIIEIIDEKDSLQPLITYLKTNLKTGFLTLEEIQTYSFD